jgi:nickel transport protein
MVAAAVLGFTVAGAPSPGWAHAIESSLERITALNDELMLESRFSNGEPADDAVVRLLPPGGEPIEVGRTDASGRIRFSLPSQAAEDWEVQVDGGPGHRDYLELNETGAAAPSLGRRPAAPVRTAISNPRLVNDPWVLLAGLTLIGGGAAGMLAMRRRF